jgi:hypothetical protein
MKNESKGQANQREPTDAEGFIVCAINAKTRKITARPFGAA